MKYTVELITDTENLPDDYAEKEYVAEIMDRDCLNMLLVRHNGKIILAELDGGEPEDRYFYRDWSWVKPALEEAYQLGVDDANYEG